MFGLDSIKLIIFGSMILAIVVLGAGDAVLWANLGTKDAKIAELTTGLDLKTQDAKRWEAASDLRDGAIVTLTGKLNDQSAAVEQGRAREAGLRVSLDQARATNDALQQQADQLSKELDDEASKAPTDVAPLGPIVLRRAPGLFE